ncbi:GNAT family N-acetyltransferase [Streptomyces sp. URMC 129]|uniref:GNAT family N-acetyltransferase n=1 Tax=Streptomyces sp. URMC 129 TaxID=3423407 RepID=UPI003F1A4CBA
MRREPLVSLVPWSEEDLALLRRQNAPELMTHLGGPEPEQKLLDRHQRYLALPGTGRGRMFRVLLLPERVPAGSIGFWETERADGTPVYETGWHVLPEFQGRGVATAAAVATARAAASARGHRYLHAFPAVANPASNAVCRKAGFALLGPIDVEYPRGHWMRCNDWRLDLAEFTEGGSHAGPGVG